MSDKLINIGFGITALASAFLIVRNMGLVEMGIMGDFDFVVRFIVLLLCLVYSLKNLGAFERK